MTRPSFLWVDTRHVSTFRSPPKMKPSDGKSSRSERRKTIAPSASVRVKPSVCVGTYALTTRKPRSVDWRHLDTINHSNGQAMRWRVPPVNASILNSELSPHWWWRPSWWCGMNPWRSRVESRVVEKVSWRSMISNYTRNWSSRFATFSFWTRFTFHEIPRRLIAVTWMTRSTTEMTLAPISAMVSL